MYKAGSIISFTYRHLIGPTEDPYKKVFVLNPNWQNKLHGLDLKRMTPAQINVIHAILDPAYRAGKKVHPYPLVNDILRRMDPTEEIKNPMAFYQKFCKPFLHTAGDVYRTYIKAKMFGIRVIRESTMEGKQYNPRPLFRK